MAPNFAILPCILPLGSPANKGIHSKLYAPELHGPTERNGRESASDLLQVGINVGGNAVAAWTPVLAWPKNPRALAGRLRRAQTPLRALGIEIVFGREGRLGTRTIRITAMGENRTHDTVSTVSRVSDHGDRAGLNHPPPGLEQAL